MDQPTVDAYNVHAKNYDDDTIDFWEKFPVTFFDHFIELSNGSVLDVGSGPGRDGLVFRDAGLNVTCLDASQAMVDLSTERGLKSVVGDLLALPFENESFDSVWAYTSLIHVPKSELAQAYREIRRVLKPNGIFGLGMIEGDSEGYKDHARVTMPRWFSFFQKEEIEKHLHDHQFEILHFETFKPNTKNYLNFIARKK